MNAAPSKIVHMTPPVKMYDVGLFGAFHAFLKTYNEHPTIRHLLRHLLHNPQHSKLKKV